MMCVTVIDWWTRNYGSKQPSEGLTAYEIFTQAYILREEISFSDIMYGTPYMYLLSFPWNSEWEQSALITVDFRP